MRKKIFSITIGAIFAFAIGWNIYQSKAETRLSDLLLSNIESLAETETIKIDCDTWFKDTCVNLVINGVSQKVEGRRK